MKFKFSILLPLQGVDISAYNEKNGDMGKKTPDMMIVTVGYEGLQIEEFAEKLKDSAVTVLVDVRKNAISRKKGFSKKKLSERMDEIGIQYIHMPELGIPSSLRKDLDTSRPETYSALWTYYDESIIPNVRDSIKQIIEVAKKKRTVALTCFESDPKFCHRNRIANEISSIVNNKNVVLHI